MKKDTLSLRIGVVMLLTAVLICGAMLVCSAASAEEDADKPLTGLTATEIVAQMGFGWNLGNTFDATGGTIGDITSQEQSWGNPVVTKEQIDAVATAGFKTIRIPVTWARNIAQDGTYKINPAFIERVKTVVDYAFDNDLFVILNVHHESWVNLKDLDKNYMTTAKTLGPVWTQLAEAFAEYDQHLIFEGMNEPRMAGTSLEWSGNPEAYAAVNYLNQVFTNAVRSVDKGYNAERCLMIPGYAASSSANIIESVSLPTYNGEVVKNLIASMHSYAPYDFCLSDAQMDFDPTNTAQTSQIDQVFAAAKSVYLDKGIPVVLGETGVTNKDNTEARERWATYFGTKAASYGIPMVLWDNGANGNSGGECHAHMNRQEATWNYPTILEALLAPLETVEWGSALGQSTGDDYTSLIDASPIWYDTDGLTSTTLWNASYIVNPAKPSYFAEGRDIAVVYTGEGEPRLILDSEAKQQWWIPVDPTSIETVGDKKVAYFSYDAISTAMSSFNISAPSELRNMSIAVAEDNITTYEIAVTGGGSAVTYMANGLSLGTLDKMPADPTFPGLKFEGWYTTKDYRKGTEFSGEAEGDVTAYAKFSLVTEEEKDETPEPTEAPEATKAPEPTNTPAPTKDDKDSKDGAPIGIIFAIAAGAIVVIGGGIAFAKRKK